MQVVIGGAYNGKREFVKKNLYNSIDDHHIFQFEGKLPTTQFTKDDYVIIGSFENIMLNEIHLSEDELANQIFLKLREIDRTCQLICICTDIGRGIVPMEKENRKIRDACGRLYQKLFKESTQVVRVWYGLSQVLKG